MPGVGAAPAAPVGPAGRIRGAVRLRRPRRGAACVPASVRGAGRDQRGRRRTVVRGERERGDGPCEIRRRCGSVRSIACSSPTAARSRCGSCAPRARWASRPSRCTPTPTRARRTCGSPTRPCASAPPRRASRTCRSRRCSTPRADVRAPVRSIPATASCRSPQAFAEAVADAGLTFIGPPAQVIAALGSKVGAKRIAERAGVPTVPGYHGDDQAGLATHACGSRLSAAGQGVGAGRRRQGHARRARPRRARSMRSSALRGEARAAFGDDTLLLERYIERPRHVEIQILGDQRPRPRRPSVGARVLGAAPSSVDRRGVAVAGARPGDARRDGRGGGHAGVGGRLRRGRHGRVHWPRAGQE